eukprot:6451966-Karenia_brevis.AAC.1
MSAPRTKLDLLEISASYDKSVCMNGTETQNINIPDCQCHVKERPPQEIRSQSFCQSKPDTTHQCGDTDFKGEPQRTSFADASPAST